MVLALAAASILWAPALPAQGRLSYGSQLAVLKKKELWTAMIGVILINGSIFGVYSYLSSYLGEVTALSAQRISVLLGAVYAGMLGFGNDAIPAAALVLAWGVLAGAGGSTSSIFVGGMLLLLASAALVLVKICVIERSAVKRSAFLLKEASE